MKRIVARLIMGLWLGLIYSCMVAVLLVTGFPLWGAMLIPPGATLAFWSLCWAGDNL